MNKTITILFVLLLAQQALTLRINTHFDDAVDSNNTVSANTDEIPQVLGELQEAVEKVLNDSRKEGEENETLEQLAKHRVDEALEDAREEIGRKLNETNEDGTTRAQEIDEKANEDLNRTLSEGEEALPEVGRKFVAKLTRAFNEGYLSSVTDGNGTVTIGATEKLNAASKAGYEAGAEELKNQLNEALFALNGLFGVWEEMI